MNGRNDEAWAVFWCSLLSPLSTGEIPADQRGDYFRELSQQERLLPNGQRKQISVRTLRRQWRRLRLEGVTGLFRRRRKDRGQARRARLTTSGWRTSARSRRAAIRSTRNAS